MGLSLPGSRALVTGASSGIGAATAEALAAAGASVVLTGTDPGRLAGVAARTGGRVLAADLTDPRGLDRVCAAARDTDLLVCAAGRGWVGPAEDLGPGELAGLVSLNLVAPLRLAAVALPGMRARRRGHLVFLASVAVVGVGGEAAYSATKAGLRAFADGVRHEVAGEPIGVTTVLPGVVDTPFLARRGYRRRIPRPVPPSAVAGAVLDAVRQGRAEVFVPRWLTVPARLRGATPTLFARLADRFG